MGLMKTMGLLLLLALAIEAIRGGNGRGAARRSRWGSMTSDQVNQFRKSLSHTNLDRFYSALDRMRSRGNQNIEPDSKEQKDMEERLKHIRTHTRSKGIHEGGDSLSEVNDNLGVSANLYQGDMALDDSQVDQLLGDYVEEESSSSSDAARKKRQAFRTSRYPAFLWSPNFYYYFDSSLSSAARTAAQLAIDFWQNSTCIQFIQSTTNPNRVRFFQGSGCYSYVGMIGGVQDLSLGRGCESFGTAAHEIGHALGFFHEQSRVDRDNAITINTANIMDGWADQFDKESSSTNYNYGMPYEYGSIMQYGASSTSRNGGPTMVARVTPYQDVMGSDIVAFYDISMMNEHYQCKGRCTSGAACVNGGFRNPRNCNQCICPSGWAGITCSERPAGCGSMLTATSTAQTLTITVGAGTTIEQPTFATCNYVITAPVGNKVEITVTSLQNQQCFDGCVYTGLEVKAMNDHRYTGIRYCCSNDAGTKIVAEGNVVPVIAFNRYYKSTATISYRYVSSSTASTVVVSQFPSAAATYSPSTGGTTGGGGGTGGGGSGGTTKVCIDDANCATWASNGFCSSAAYTTDQKKSYCPNRCNLCV